MATGDTSSELAAEQSYVSRLYQQLDTLRARAATALQEVRAAPIVPTPAGRAERDAFDALHSERLRQLEAVEDRLAFGRLDLTSGDRRYVGRVGLSDDAQHQLLVDWRAPAAAPFYRATSAAPGGVIRRRHLATRGRDVVSVDDELLDADQLSSDDLPTVTGDGALMSALTAHRTGRMRDIVATLQAEQDEIVRSPLQGVLVVEGGPGTGKTAVALHRAAYLLYTHRERISRSGVLVVGPTPVFLRYIEQVLPSLGETGVVLATPGQLFPGLDTDAGDPPAVARVKADLRMARVVRAAVRARQRVPSRPVPLVLDTDPIVLRPQVVAEARARARQGGRPHNDARVTFVKHVLDDLATQLATARRLDGDEDSLPDLLAELRASRDVRREVNLCWMPLSAETFLRSLLRSPQHLATAANGILSADEQALLLREDDAPWTVADVPLLDEVAELIGADVGDAQRAAATRAAAEAERRDIVAYARGVLAMSGEAGAMMTAEMLADRFADGGPVQTVVERARSDRSWTFGHVVVDEAQELSPMMWRLLARRAPSRSMTVVGDLAQTGSVAGAGSWRQVLDPFAEGRWRVQRLTVNYRTPGRIMDLATRMLEASGWPTRPPRSAREGDWAPRAGRLVDGGTPAVAAAVAAALREDDAALGGGRFAVVLPRSAGDDLAPAIAAELDARDLADRVQVLRVDAVKGLEFDGVVVVEPAAILAGSERGANDLYVALTRSTQRLTMLHVSDLPPGLDPARDGAPVAHASAAVLAPSVP